VIHSELTTSTVVKVVLEGGPSDLPQEVRQRWAEADADRIKVPYCGGYEHFERTNGHVEAGTESTSVVYRWVRRTRVAE
jgi:hypothetical protein